MVVTAIFGAVAESEHRCYDDDGAGGEVSDWEAGTYAGAFGETVGAAHYVGIAGGGVGDDDLLPAGDFGVDAVGSEAVLMIESVGVG